MCSLRGKQLYQIPSESVDNVEHVLAIGDPGLSNVKVFIFHIHVSLSLSLSDKLQDPLRVKDTEVDPSVAKLRL